MSIKIAIANRKGGSGKTTTAANLADGLALAGKRVLLIDADSQAQATIHCGILPHTLGTTLYEAMLSQRTARPVAKEAVITGCKRFDLIPSKQDLSALEIELSGYGERDLLLHNLILEFESTYDYVIIDLPPALGLVTVNGLVASDLLMIPMEMNFLSMDGLAQMMNIFYRINAELNPHLRLLGIVPVKCDMRTNLSRMVLKEIRQNFGEEKLLPNIRSDVKLAEAPSFGKTIFEYAPSSRGAQDYSLLAQEVMKRGSKR